MKKVLMFFSILFIAVTLTWSQEVKVPELGSVAPSFTAQSTNGEINFPADYGKSWKILFSHPKDFTPVCSSEILELAHDQKVFDDLNTKIVVLSTDLLDLHKSWKDALQELHYKNWDPVKIGFPIVSDESLQVSKEYGMLHSVTSTSQNIRGVYFIDPDNKIRAIFFYPNQVGRNIKEIERTLVALQTTYKNKDIVTPADWTHGEDVIVPVVSQTERQNLGKPGTDYYQVAWFMIFKPFH